MRKIILAISILSVILFTGCMSTTYMEVLKPAAFKVPSHIQNVATVNRTKSDKKVANIFESIFSGEAIWQDREGATNAVQGLASSLTLTPRFTVTHTNMVLPGGGIKQFQAPLTWAEIQSICNKYNADAIAVLEVYDTDINKSCKQKTRTKKDKNGREYTETYYDADMSSNVLLGWRLYDPQSKTIIDEFIVNETMFWDAQGSTEDNAYANLPSQVSVTNRTSEAAGLKYGSRIAPTWVRVGRSYYSKHKKEDRMKMATKLAKSGQWMEAAEIWKDLAESGDEKLAKKATYNMALACEVEGKLDLAVNWAEKSYVEYGNKKGKAYINQLKVRQMEADRVTEQMGE